MSSFFEDPRPGSQAPMSQPLPRPSGGGGGEDEIIICVPQTPAGLLRCFVKDVKTSPKNTNNIIFVLVIDEQPHKGAEVAMFFNKVKPDDVKRLMQWLGVLGHPVSSTGQFGINKGLLKNKPCKAMLVPWHKNDGTVEASIGRLPPDPDPNGKYHSPEFHAWAQQNSFNYDTLKAVAGGIMPV